MFATSRRLPATTMSSFARGVTHHAKASLKEGDVVPSVVFKCRVRDPTSTATNPFAWKDVTTDDLLAKKRVVIFALPGGKYFV